MSEDELHEPLFMWSETYVMQAASGRRKAVSTELKALDKVTTIQMYWEKLEFNCARTANLCSLHIFKRGVKPQYDDPQNSNGGHFKMKPFTVDAAHLTLKALSTAFINEEFPNHAAVNGLTIAKKAKSSLIKVWMTDSLNQPVIVAMNEWFDENVDHLCGRRLFSPHKYILKTFSRQQAREKQEAAMPKSPSGCQSTWNDHTSCWVQQLTGSVESASASTLLSPTKATICRPDSPLSSPMPSSPRGDRGVHCCYNPPLGQWHPASSNSFYSSLTLSDSDFDVSGCESPAADPMSPVSEDALEQGANVTHRYTQSLGHLMSCPRSDPTWAECTAAALSVRLETTVRKCHSWYRTTASGEDCHANLVEPVCVPSDLCKSDMFG
eukprot:GGOE01018766.1.p1 GENE.GGOE01018766.1~~GGOE01018766.1.p1  ORF type:complete len:393 (-),score=42.18 GGOE01018766.1:343-1485(-)